MDTALQSRTLRKRRISADLKTSLRNTRVANHIQLSHIIQFSGNVFFLVWGRSKSSLNSWYFYQYTLRPGPSPSCNTRNQQQSFNGRPPMTNPLDSPFLLPLATSMLAQNSCGSKPYLTVLYRAIAMFVTHFNYHFHPEHCPRKASQMYSDTLDKAMQCVTVICGFRIVKWSSNNFSISPNDIRTPSIVWRKRWK